VFDLSTSSWLRHLELPQLPFALTVTGGGRVASELPGIACSTTCTTLWDAGSVVVLRPTPAPGRRFIGWGGACSGVDCAVTVTAPVAVRAIFGPSRVRLSARVSGRGRIVGRMIACPTRCSADVDAGAPLTLSPKAATGWRFAGWAGACSGTRATCRVVPEAALSVRALFVKRR
jgi:hypothetical protein